MKPSKNSIQFLSSIAQNKISPHVWFAILSLYNHQVSYTANLIISTLEYVQSMVDTFLVNMMAYSGSADMPKIFHPLIDIAQLICPGFLLNFQGNVTTPTIIILVTLAIYTVLKYCLFGYIVFKSVSQRESEAVLLTLWRWTVKLQGRVIYYFVSSVWIGLYLAALNDRLNVGSVGKTAIMVLAWIFIGIEYLLSFVLLAKISHPIPMKHAMSAKNQITEIITVTQKITIQIIIITLNKETADKVAWICSLTALIFSLFRTVYYLTSFPHYKLKTIQYHAGLLIVTLCLNVGFLLQSLVGSIYDQSISLSLWAIEWIILSFLLVLMARNYINRSWTNLVIQKQTNNRKLLLHKIIAIKEVLRVNTAPKGKMDGHPLSYLLKKTTAAISDNPGDFSSKESFQKVTISYLEDCLAKFPSSNLLKLYLGYCYAKKLKKYGIAIKILKELQHSSSYSTSLTASLLIHALQESIKIDYAGNRSKLDLYTYMKDVTSVAQLKEVIVQQAERQVIFYTECNNTTQNLSKIHSLAQEIDVYKQKIEGRIQRLLETAPDHYLEPVIVYAYYSYVLNHSINQYTRFMKLYNQKSRKYEKVFSAEKLCKENLYHKDTHLLMLSGERKNITSVMYSSRSFLKDLGKDIVGRDIGHIVPEYFRNNVYSSMKFLLEEGNKAHLDHVTNGFHFHLTKGSLAPCNTYIGIHPFFGQEMHYLLMVRKIPNADETIMMKENGDILTFTDRVGKRLGLFSLRKKLPENKVMNISMISHDLARINFAFNVVDPYETNETSAKIHSIAIKEIAQNSLVEQANKSLRTCIRSSRFGSRKIRSRYPTVHKDLTIEEAKELYSVYTTRGADLELNAVVRDGSHKKKCFTYHCKIERKPFAAEMLKMITLSEEQKGKYSVKNKPMVESTDRTKRETTLGNAEESVPQIESEHLASLSSHLSSETETESESDEYIDTVNMLSETNRLQRVSKRRQPILTSDREGLLSTEQQGTVQTQPIELETHQSPRKTTKNHKHKDTVFHFSSKIDNSFYQSSNGSEKIRKSGGIQLSKEYEDALSLKYYPGFYKTLRILFYLVTLYILASQIALKKVVDNDLQALKVRKNVMSMTEIRNYELLTLYKYATSIWMFATGMQDQNALPPVARAPAYMLLMKESLTELTMSNKNLLVSADALDRANREKMFRNNVQLYDGNSNSVPFGVNLTSFQATDKIIETSFRVISSTQDLSASVPDLEIVLRNVLNGNLLADETTNEILMLSLDELKTAITKSNIVVMIACQSSLTFIFVFFCIIVYKQYQREKLNMLAFAKLDRIEIIKVCKKVEYFKELILKETEFENIDETKFSNFENKEAIRTVIINERNRKNRTARQPDLTGIVRKYQTIPLRMLIAIFLICGLVYLKTSVAQHSIDLLTNNLLEINFADHVRLTVHLSATIAFSFLTQNGTLVRNLDGVQQFHEELALLPGLIEEIPEVLDSDSDDIYDQEIQDILFGNACAYVNSDEPSIPITTYCDTIRKDASKAGVINFLTLFESDMAEFDLMYTASNKTKEALNQLQRTTFNMRVPSMTVIVNLMMVISQRLGNIFGDTLNRSQLYNDITSGLLLALLVVLGAVIHFRMINSMREAENKFRNVLKMLPARIVVPNFMLKSYLIRTCKGRFDLVKAFTSE